MITLTLTLTLLAHTTLAESPFCCKDVESHPNLERLAAPSECGVPADTPAPAVAGRIRGGERVTLGDRPWMVYIVTTLRNGDGYGACGGTLISRTHVLTAAHCVNMAESPTNITARIGENVLSTDIDCDWTGRCSPSPIDIKVALAIVHEHYDPFTAYNDIALLKLPREVKFNDFVKPICLPTSCELLEEDLTGQTVEATGWGYNDLELVKIQDVFDWKREQSQNLMKLSSLKIEDTSKVCPTYIRNRTKVATASSQMCAINIVDPTRYKNVCNGDSGGPLTRHINIRGVAKYVQVGITSIGNNCTASSVYEILFGYPQKPSHYTRISWFTFWILEHLSD